MCQVIGITTRLEYQGTSSRNFRSPTGSLPFLNWEIGLREAVYQAFIRERNLHPNLREFLYSAPILGKQDTATPFGDIAILARGQLYSAPGGFQFVQDPYQNDCEGCHNTPLTCDRIPCERWRPQAHERLLALWTVKRIRHRDSNYGFKYELEFKISPMEMGSKEPFITRFGKFDYNVPGHTFIVKSNPRPYLPYQESSVHHEKVYRSSDRWTPNYGGPNYNAQYLPPPPPIPFVNEYYDKDPRRPGNFPSVLYDSPDIHNKKPYRPFNNNHIIPHDSKETEEQLFNDLITTLASKTTTKDPKAPTTESSSDFLFSKPSTQNILNAETYQTSQLLPTPSTILQNSPLLPTISAQTTPFLQESTKEEKPTNTIRFPTTEGSTINDHTATAFSPITQFTQFSEPDPLYSSTRSTTVPSTTTSVFYRPSTTKVSRPTLDDNFDLFGENKTPGTTKHDSITEDPGEKVIEIVKPPQILTTDDYNIFDVPSVKSTETTPQREDKFITIASSPSSIVFQQSSKIPTSTEELWYQVTTIPTTSTTKEMKSTTQKEIITTTNFNTEARNGNENGFSTDSTSEATTQTTPNLLPRTTTTSRRTTSSSLFTKVNTYPNRKTKVFSLSKTTTIPTTPSTISTTPKWPRTTKKQTKATRKRITNTRRQITTSRKYTTAKKKLTSTTTHKFLPTIPSIAIETTPTVEEVITVKEITVTNPTIASTISNSPTTITENSDLHTTSTDKTTNPTTLAEFNTNSPTTINFTTETQMMNLNSTETSFKDVQNVTEPLTTTTKRTSSTQGFLLDEELPKNQNNKKDDSDFETDIFGAPPNKPQIDSKTTQEPKIINSKEIDDIFNSKPEKPFTNENLFEIPEESTTPKIIYSNFYTNPTEETIFSYNSSEVKGLGNENNKVQNKTEPITSQSYITSVSFEVNKRNDTTTPIDFLQPEFEYDTTTNATVFDVTQNNSNYRVYKAEFPEENLFLDYNKTKSNESNNNNNKIFDALTLSVVNHAKTIDYLQSNHSNTGNSQKYKRKGLYKNRRPHKQNPDQI